MEVSSSPARSSKVRARAHDNLLQRRMYVHTPTQNYCRLLYSIAAFTRTTYLARGILSLVNVCFEVS